MFEPQRRSLTEPGEPLLLWLIKSAAYLGALLLLWYVVALAVTVRWVHRMSPLRSAVAVALPILLVVLVVALVLGLLDLLSLLI